MRDAAASLVRAVLEDHPEWSSYVQEDDDGTVEVAVPAPSGSRAGHLVVFITPDDDTWVRFGPPRMCYSIDDHEELRRILAALLSDSAAFAVTMLDDTWVETTLVKPGHPVEVPPGHRVTIVSWSGRHDTDLAEPS